METGPGRERLTYQGLSNRLICLWRASEGNTGGKALLSIELGGGFLIAPVRLALLAPPTGPSLCSGR